MKRQRIAVVGAGVSGLVSAYLLSKQHEVHLFERNGYFGGHANTHEVDGVGVDTGFIVYSEPAYPRFSRLLEELGVGTQPSERKCTTLGASATWTTSPSSNQHRQGDEVVAQVFVHRDP